MTLTRHDFDGEGSVRSLPVIWPPDLTERLDYDSEGGMFRALGTLSDLTQLNAALEP